MTTKIYVRALMRDDLQEKWLQHLRDFDTANPGCHFDVGVDGPDEPMADMIKRLQVEPGLTFTHLFKRAKWED